MPRAVSGNHPISPSETDKQARPPDKDRLLAYQIFTEDSHLRIPINVAHALGGIEPAGLLADLIAKERLFYLRNKLSEGGWFWCTVESMWRNTVLTAWQQRAIIDRLEMRGLIETDVRGMPARRHFRITHAACIALQTTPPPPYSEKAVNTTVGKKRSSKETSQLVPRKLRTIQLDTDNLDCIGEDSNTRATSESCLPLSDLPLASPSSAPPPVRRAPRLDPLVELFKAQPHAPKHRPGTKGYRAASHLLNVLRRGEFAHYFAALSRKELRRNPGAPEQHWTDEELRQAIERVALLFDPSHSPQNKGSIPRRLATLIFNPRTNRSLFLECAASPPRLLAEAAATRAEETMTDADKAAARKLAEAVQEAARLKDRPPISAFAHFLRALPAEEKRLAAYCPHAALARGDLARRLYVYIGQRFDGWRDLRPGMFRVGTPSWAEFLRWLEDDYALSPGEFSGGSERREVGRALLDPNERYNAHPYGKPPEEPVNEHGETSELPPGYRAYR